MFQHLLQGEIKIIAKRLEAKFNESYANVTTQLDLLPDDSYSFHFDADLFVELPSLFVSLIRETSWNN